ncbi:hypothetical protein Ahy_B07g088589 isoform B [Arachis hypogaea]|uniref:Ubiquinone biosynthesis O-methyltransferase, mitochondrial n=1 Tax=Arachis hypogaea TaxID=3818 RepID=A0A444YEY0_ARAHY|nr:hypothetical protein Ahy_B07g088589 isoform B [Arachis hypogaea]
MALNVTIHRILRHRRFLNSANSTLHLTNTRCFSHAPSPSPSQSSKANDKDPHSGSSSLKDNELAKFAAISDTWWDSEGPFKPLHLMNPTRLAFIRSTLCRHFKRDPYSTRPFERLKIVDVGCGGGILSEPLARLGATVTGVDAVEKNIKIARLHADLDPTTSTIEYCCTTAGTYTHLNSFLLSIAFSHWVYAYQDHFECSQVIEHVANPEEFCKSLAALTNPDGATVVSTINRSMRAYATAIVAAEYILHWLPKGTHQWSSFLTPEELAMILHRAGINVEEMAGFVYNPLTGRWLLSDDISVNFIAFATKSQNAI